MLILSSTVLTVSAEEKADIKKGTAVIDGVIDEIWDHVDAYPISKVNPNTGNDSGTTGYWKGVWSGNDLYILVVVNDANIVTMNDNQDDENRLPNAGDGVEIYIDVLNDRSEDPGYQNIGEIHFGMFPTGKMHLFDNGVADMDMLNQNSKASVNGNQIVYEFKLPLDKLSGGRLSSVSVGHKMGLDVQICDSDTGTDWRLAALNWSDDLDLAWQSTVYCGTITLTDVEAMPQVVEPEEPLAVEADEPAPVPSTPASPTTGNIGMVLMVLAVLGSAVVLKKRTSI